MASNGSRDARLRVHFRKVLDGELVRNSREGKLFIESICSQKDPVACVQRLISSAPGIASLRLALTADLTRQALNEAACALLGYLQEPTLKIIGGGQFLQKFVLVIVSPPIFWDAFLAAQRAGHLSTDATRCFAWLLLQLVSLPTDKATSTYRTSANDVSLQRSLLASFDSETQIYAQKIKHTLEATSRPDQAIGDARPGGRHDNDHEEISSITILPTTDEIKCTEDPFLRRAADVDDVSGPGRLPIHIDNQFRLLREDMLRDLREELPVALGVKKGRMRVFMVQNLFLDGVECDEKHPWSVRLKCFFDLPRMPKSDEKKRKEFLTENRNYLRNGSLACLVVDRLPAALVTIRRDENLLAQLNPSICIVFSGNIENTSRAILQLRIGSEVQLIQLNTAVFAYEPVLRQLQAINQMYLRDEIVHWNLNSPVRKIASSQSSRYDKLVRLLDMDASSDLKELLDLPRTTRLDKYQAKCFLAGITQRLSLVQGPPGTGKSFIGALIAKAIYCYTEEKVLVICYTNHALDQFLDDLRKVGIPDDSIVRLGSAAKTSATNKALLLSAQTRSYKFTASDYAVLNVRRDEAREHGTRLQAAFTRLQADSTSKADVMAHLEFASETWDFAAAFQIPKDTSGMTRVGKKGKAIDEFYLLDQWARGHDAGIFTQEVRSEHAPIWQMNIIERQEALKRWKTVILQDRVSEVTECGRQLNEALVDINTIYGENDRRNIREKRIIGCTTTGAANFVQSIQSASPGVLLVEEAGEILESHVLTALGPETKQAVLIGDHKQLRPKAHYDLSVEKGDGYDLNRSLFERLIIKGYPHQTLSEQHRMRPEISDLVRQLTYSALTDALSTTGRPSLRGFQDNLIFVNHNVPEEEALGVPDFKDPTSPLSKENMFEAQMTLKCVRYLAQQGYGTDKIVVLTPYVAQLRVLFDVLKKENDPVLNDLDSYDLVRAGLMPSATAKQLKRPLRISTVDNYQGEESDIVVISLTRSNPSGNIGFLSQPERLNVLLSRARDAMILIGNAETFLKSRSGKELWQRLLELLKHGSHIYDGFPVKCERHPDRTNILRSPANFDACPDGGCNEPCTTKLKCGIHNCPQRCHQLYDHTKMLCKQILNAKCAIGHVLTWECHASKPGTCNTCEKKRLAEEKKQREAFERQRRRDAQEQEHAKQIAELDEYIRVAREEQQDHRRSQELMQALEQKKRDLENSRNIIAQAARTPPAPVSGPNKQPRGVSAGHASTSTRPIAKSKPSGDVTQRHESKSQLKVSCHKSRSELEWERLKEQENISNDQLDSLMSMTGLENVKEKFLTIKAKIDTTQRQGIDLKKERFGVVLLGNPGTGKTTVARLYAGFLFSLGVIPGSEFVETTGSGLASDGVGAAKKLIERILNAGGGAFFLDEAYQLVLGHNYGGKSVLDYLLAETENQVGKIVFILAGYNKQMESFFEHNPGLESRMPYRLQFHDYNDSELHIMLTRMIKSKWSERMKVENGLPGLYARIVARRVGVGRGREGFGNARALENVLAKISERQAERLRQERTTGMLPDDFLLTKEDLIGPEPTTALMASSAWKDLQTLTGLCAVKDAVRTFIDRVALNYKRELDEKPPVQVSLNRVFVGPPGTGKTTVGKLYAQILADIGLLSNAEVVLKNPADFTGGALGQSEEKTKSILKATEGKVLIIDEAYMLGSGGVGQAADPYKTSIVDTIVAEVQSTPGEDRCVLLLGYEDQMEEMFRNTNPGLSRRFPLADAFRFEDFDDDQLLEILNFKLKKQGLGATDQAKKVAISVLSKARRRRHFGNAGQVENMISQAKSAHQLRENSLPVAERSIDIIFQPQDFDADFDREKGASTNLRDLFKEIVGSEGVVKRFEGYVRAVEAMRARGRDPEEHIPFNFIFKGPPGTGKTTTARKIGQIYYDMGFLSSTKVHECSATDLIAGFVGQTGLKTIEVLDKALGAVLFIDEAYRLGEGNFATEAVNTLVDSLTKPAYMGKMLVVLAGYEGNMNELLKINPGLSSRFPEEIIFQNMLPENAFKLLKQKLDKSGIEVEETQKIEEISRIIATFHALSDLPSWGNGRDVETLAKSIARATFQSADDSVGSDFLLTLTQLQKHLDILLQERTSRETISALPFRRTDSGLPMADNSMIATPPQKSTITDIDITNSETNIVHEAPLVEPTPDHTSSSQAPERDPGVADHVWAQLLRDKATAEKIATDSTIQLSKLSQATQSLEVTASNSAIELANLEMQAKEKKASDDMKRRHEEMRLQHLRLLAAKRDAEEREKRVRAAVEAARKQEAKAQEKLRCMGICPAGFRWIKQDGGYRCSAGGHFVGSAELGFK